MKVVLKFSPVARRYRYRGRRRMLRALGPDLASMTTWSAVDTELNGEMAEVINRDLRCVFRPATPRVHKLAHYLPVFESIVEGARPIRMLELGSFYGDSLQIWQKYLHPDSLIVGIDLNSKLVKIADSGGIHVRIVGEKNDPFLSVLAAEFGPFDVILDAGSQTSSHMVDSFRCLFANALSDSGVYVVEDVFCDYWAIYNHFSFIDLVKALIDAIYGHYQVATSETNFRVGHVVIVRRATRDLSRSIYRS